MKNTNLTKLERELSSLYDSVGDDLYYYALGFVQDDAVAEDILQCSFVKLWESYSEINDKIGFLKTTIRNSSVNHIRDSKITERREQSYIDYHESNNVDYTSLLEKAEQINNVIKNLPDKCQKIFLLNVVEGLRYVDIAEDLDISVNTVKSQVKKAYRIIREKVDQNQMELLIIFIFFQNLRK